MSILSDALAALTIVADHREQCPICAIDVECGDDAVLCKGRLAHDHDPKKLAEAAVEDDFEEVFIGATVIGYVRLVHLVDVYMAEGIGGGTATGFDTKDRAMTALIEMAARTESAA